MNVEILRTRLANLDRALTDCGENALASQVRRALAGSEQDLRQFLVSNELWGGAGSIAAQAGVMQGREVKRRIESALVDLGTEQISQSVTNCRTKSWVDAFSSWHRRGI